MKRSNDTSHDVAVLGATGYVGRRLVGELNRVSRQLGLRVLATVRSDKKAEELKKEFTAIDFEILDVLDAAQVDDIVQKTRLVVNCVGPFDLYGENVVSACARLGRHYLDITGEVLFARRMIERYDGVAKKSGAVIVPFAGFDSVPADLGVYLIGKEMRDQHQQAVASVDLVFNLRGGLNGGTAATALDMGAKLSYEVVSNLNFLAPERPYLEYEELYRPRFVKLLKRWVAPFFMEPINNKVVYRSLALGDSTNLLFSPDFIYRESVFVPGGYLSALGVARALKGVYALLKSAQLRSLFARVVPKSGEGPSERQMQNGYFSATIVAQGTDGYTLVRKMKCHGDPGNVATVKILMACIRTALSDSFTSQGGLRTPATAFGSALLPALRESGISWE